ncbi:MAG TPA: hypothetical protein VMW19_02160 [Myxococcota bacterium]|nr:hypothetical protein [Myxococcota bacterium]
MLSLLGLARDRAADSAQQLADTARRIPLDLAVALEQTEHTPQDREVKPDRRRLDRRQGYAAFLPRRPRLRELHADVLEQALLVELPHVLVAEERSQVQADHVAGADLVRGLKRRRVREEPALEGLAAEQRRRSLFSRFLRSPVRARREQLVDLADHAVGPCLVGLPRAESSLLPAALIVNHNPPCALRSLCGLALAAVLVEPLHLRCHR